MKINDKTIDANNNLLLISKFKFINSSNLISKFSLYYRLLSNQ